MDAYTKYKSICGAMLVVHGYLLVTVYAWTLPLGYMKMPPNATPLISPPGQFAARPQQYSPQIFGTQQLQHRLPGPQASAVPIASAQHTYHHPLPAQLHSSQPTFQLQQPLYQQVYNQQPIVSPNMHLSMNPNLPPGNNQNMINSPLFGMALNTANLRAHIGSKPPPYLSLGIPGIPAVPPLGVNPFPPQQLGIGPHAPASPQQTSPVPVIDLDPTEPPEYPVTLAIVATPPPHFGQKPPGIPQWGATQSAGSTSHNTGQPQMIYYDAVTKMLVTVNPQTKQVSIVGPPPTGGLRSPGIQPPGGLSPNAYLMPGVSTSVVKQPTMSFQPLGHYLPRAPLPQSFQRPGQLPLVQTLGGQAPGSLSPPGFTHHGVHAIGGVLQAGGHVVGGWTPQGRPKLGTFQTPTVHTAASPVPPAGYVLGGLLQSGVQTPGGSTQYEMPTVGVLSSKATQVGGALPPLGNVLQPGVYGNGSLTQQHSPTFGSSSTQYIGSGGLLSPPGIQGVRGVFQQGVHAIGSLSKGIYPPIVHTVGPPMQHAGQATGGILQPGVHTIGGLTQQGVPTFGGFPPPSVHTGVGLPQPARYAGAGISPAGFQVTGSFSQQRAPIPGQFLHAGFQGGPGMSPAGRQVVESPSTSGMEPSPGHPTPESISAHLEQTSGGLPGIQTGRRLTITGGPSASSVLPTGVHDGLKVTGALNMQVASSLLLGMQPAARRSSGNLLQSGNETFGNLSQSVVHVMGDLPPGRKSISSGLSRPIKRIDGLMPSSREQTQDGLPNTGLPLQGRQTASPIISSAKHLGENVLPQKANASNAVSPLAVHNVTELSSSNAQTQIGLFPPGVQIMAQTPSNPQTVVVSQRLYPSVGQTIGSNSKPELLALMENVKHVIHIPTTPRPTIMIPKPLIAPFLPINVDDVHTARSITLAHIYSQRQHNISLGTSTTVRPDVSFYRHINSPKTNRHIWMQPRPVPLFTGTHKSVVIPVTLPTSTPSPPKYKIEQPVRLATITNNMFHSLSRGMNLHRLNNAPRQVLQPPPIQRFTGILKSAKIAVALPASTPSPPSYKIVQPKRLATIPNNRPMFHSLSGGLNLHRVNNAPRQVLPVRTVGYVPRPTLHSAQRIGRPNQRLIPVNQVNQKMRMLHPGSGRLIPVGSIMQHRITTTTKKPINPTLILQMREAVLEQPCGLVGGATLPTYMHRFAGRGGETPDSNCVCNTLSNCDGGRQDNSPSARHDCAMDVGSGMSCCCG